jgi:hypothetical protein
LPLAVAVCHVAGSLHMMILMLQLFGLMDVPYIALNTLPPRWVSPFSTGFSTGRPPRPTTAWSSSSGARATTREPRYTQTVPRWRVAHGLWRFSWFLCVASQTRRAHGALYGNAGTETGRAA